MDSSSLTSLSPSSLSKFQPAGALSEESEVGYNITRRCFVPYEYIQNFVGSRPTFSQTLNRRRSGL